MRLAFLSLYIFVFVAAITAVKAQDFSPDEYETSKGKLTISFIGHGTLMFNFDGKVIHVDPWSKLADYSALPKADIILITHSHPDHYDTAAIKKISKENTTLVVNSEIFESTRKGELMRNGDAKVFQGIRIEAVLAYNTTADRSKFHPKGRDNGYVINFGNRRVYVAGDTENIPEMAFLKNIYIAFLPMNQPYTMVPEQIVDAVDKFKPKILYPYHYGDSDLEALKTLMATRTGTKLIIKPMK
jgi:L-ascorbate metabolism protein UlaG (beta-lactamase superfamily)